MAFRCSRKALSTLPKWDQDEYEENIRPEWIDKIKREHTYLGIFNFYNFYRGYLPILCFSKSVTKFYDDTLVRQIRINLSIEISQTFIFWSVWSNLLLKKSLFVNFSMCPLIVVFIKRELLRLSLKGWLETDLVDDFYSFFEPWKHSAFFMSLLFLLSPIYSSLTGLASYIS